SSVHRTADSEVEKSKKEAPYESIRQGGSRSGVRVGGRRGWAHPHAPSYRRRRRSRRRAAQPRDSRIHRREESTRADQGVPKVPRSAHRGSPAREHRPLPGARASGGRVRVPSRRGRPGRDPYYYRMVMGAYVEVLERSELRCSLQPAPKRLPVLAFLTRVCRPPRRSRAATRVIAARTRPAVYVALAPGTNTKRPVA